MSAGPKQGSAGDSALIVFARSPQMGRVKTRLAAELGAPLALAIYRYLGRRTLDTVRQLHQVYDCRVIVQYAGGKERLVRAWLGDDLVLRPQAPGDLGRRMSAAVEDALVEGATGVVVVGTDCPALEAHDIAEAFRALDDADLVLGPATDGGYYLIAVRHAPAALFERIPWSTPDTLRATVDRAAKAGLRVHLLATKADIDTTTDWAAWLDALPLSAAAELARMGLDPRSRQSATPRERND